jgi:hypothetical protein
MKHEHERIATVKGFGHITRCSCGQYTVRVPGASFHLKAEGFNLLTQMILEASNAGTREEKRRSLRVVKP